MNLVRRLEQVALGSHDGRPVDGFVRVLTLDATVAGRGIVVGTRTPLAVERDGRRVTIAQVGGLRTGLALVAAPLVSRLIVRMFTKGAK